MAAVVKDIPFTVFLTHPRADDKYEGPPTFPTVHSLLFIES